jgi:predicted Zn-dependent protease
VYEYGGGPGIRQNDTTDIRRTLVAGLYNQSVRDREAGRREDAARLTDELVRRMPGDQTVAFLAIESKIKDRQDPQGALADLAAISYPADVPRLAIRHAILTAEAWKAMGMQDSVNAILESLKQKYPDNAGVQRAIDALK